MAQRYKKITIDGRTISLHRYIYEQVHGPIPDGFYVHHINGDPLDNRIENLALMTPEEHSRHHNDKHPRVKLCVVCEQEYEPAPTKRARSRTCSRECFRALAASRVGSATPAAKIMEADVRVIRARVAAGEQQKVVGAEYGLSPQATNAMVHRRSWRHVE